AKDLARVLRVPGTCNTKPVYGPDGRAVTVVRLNLDTRYSLDVLEAALPVMPTPTPQPPRAARSVAPSAAGGTVRDLIATFNRDHPVQALAEQYGATFVGKVGRCNCGYAHTNETQLCLTSRGYLAIYSDNCRWKITGKAAVDSFDLFAIVEHQGDKKAALRAIGWKPVAPVDHQRQQTRRDYAQQRRDTQVAAIIARADADPALTDRPTIRAVLDALLDGACCWKSDLVTTHSNQRIAHTVGKSLRTVSYAIEFLEGRYIRSRLRGLDQTAMRVFLHDVQPPEAIMDLDDFVATTPPANDAELPPCTPPLRTSTDMAGEGGGHHATVPCTHDTHVHVTHDTCTHEARMPASPTGLRAPSPACTGVTCARRDLPTPVWLDIVSSQKIAPTLGSDFAETLRQADKLAALRAKYAAEALAPVEPAAVVLVEPEPAVPDVPVADEPAAGDLPAWLRRCKHAPLPPLRTPEELAVLIEQAHRDQPELSERPAVLPEIITPVEVTALPSFAPQMPAQRVLAAAARFVAPALPERSGIAALVYTVSGIAADNPDLAGGFSGTSRPVLLSCGL
ncbi:MAG: hypothetical protein WCG26_15375, partial [Chloroflexales bacterium]